MTLGSDLVHEIFQDFGLFVRMGHLYGGDVPALIEAESAKKYAQFDDDEERLRTLGQALGLDRQNVQMIESLAAGEAQVIDDYVMNRVKPAIQGLGGSAKEVLQDLAERMLEECDPPEYVLRNEVALDGPVAADPDNAGDGTLGSVVLSQYCLAQRFTVECIDASTEGSEQWSVTGSVSGTLDMATTGVAYADTTIYLEFLITAGGTAFELGDKFYFYVTCEEKRFQTFFRDRFGMVFPSAALGSETIEEAWAE